MDGRAEDFALQANDHSLYRKQLDEERFYASY
jgi:hypothetical protein